MSPYPAPAEHPPATSSSIPSSSAEGSAADAAAGGAIVVVGSINVDLTATVRRHPLPGETLHGTGGEMTPGGKGANQAVAAGLLGGSVTMIGAVGTDGQAEVALSALRSSGVDTSQVTEIEGPTGLAIVTVSEDGENTIVVVPGANAAMDAEVVRRHAEVIGAAEIVVCQGEIPRSGIEALPALTRGRLLHNPAPVMELDPAVLRGSDPLVVNEHEAALVLEQLSDSTAEAGAGAGAGAEAGAEAEAEAGAESGAEPRTESESGPAAERSSPEGVLRALLAAGVPSAVLTLGAEGSLVGDAAGIHRVPAAPVQAVDTTGAGDAFIGALAVGLARGESLPEAALLASRVGAFAATGHGAQPSYPGRRDELPALAEEPSVTADG
jgi:ribokinase